MPHTLPPAACATNTPVWTDTSIPSHTVTIKKDHMDELRSYLNGEFTRRYLSTESWTDPTITVNQTLIKAQHIDELRAACGFCKTGRSESGYCPEDDSICMDFTGTITVHETPISPVHVTEIRSAISSLMTSCICETEQCQYCADCGYNYHVSCSHCGCQDRCSGDSHGCRNGEYWVYLCGSINIPGSAPHPFKYWDGSTSVNWDGTVPWAWGGSIPGTAVLWRAPYLVWNCKCDPYTWNA